MENQEKVRKIRALPRVWKAFCQIPNGDAAYLGRTQVCKTSFCTAREYEVCSTVGAVAPVGGLRFVLPWRRVKTTRLVKRSVISGAITKALLKSSPFVKGLKGGPFPENSGKTHFVGDDCPGGHHEVPKAVGPMSEPHNCNNITGPTS